ncbi:MAG: VIT domain-containing protein [Planctomycetaceae bacterium]|nr:VIT domain-containing protein [Planctomycetaceae bacterium]
MQRLLSGLVLACLVLFPEPARAQMVIIDGPPGIRHPVRPGPRPVPAEYRIKSVDANATVRDQIARVQFSQVFENVGSRTLEARLLFPLPADAAISGLTLVVDGKELTGRLLKKDEARRIYESIVRQQRDPALLEYMGHGLYQTRVFPIPPRARRRVEIRYSQLLKQENNLVDLHLPIGTFKHSHRPIESMNISIRIASSQPIKTVFSPSHQVDIQRPDDTHAVCKLALKNVVAPDDLRLFYGTKEGLVGMNVISYRPDQTQDGYFLLLASPEVKAERAKPLAKTVVFVVDRSGSMNGKKIEQARQALRFLIKRLQPGDTFNIVAYDTTVDSFRPELQRVNDKTRKAALGFVDGLYAGGSTNIDDALQTAMAMLADTTRPNYVLFLTDGLPTVGERNEMKIAAHVKQANKVAARLYSFGVGFDVNSRLLDRLSRDHRGQSVYVRPNEDIEVQVSKLFDRIGAPLLTDLALKFDSDKAAEAAPGISRTYPRKLTDLFRGEQLVWVGRYRKSGPVKVTLTGTNGDKKQSFSFGVRLAGKSRDESNGFVEKLWALRRIGEIIDQLDLSGQNQELIDELVRLSIDHGIMTPYTSFLADEGVGLAARGNANRASSLAKTQLDLSNGRSGFAQRRIKGRLQRAVTVGNAESAFDGQGAGGPMGGGPITGPPVAFCGGGNIGTGSPRRQNVRNIGQKSFFRKEGVWRDSTVTARQEKQAIKVKQYSKPYFDLAASHGGTLARYLVFNEPVLVNLGNRTYRIDPPARP